MVRSLSWRDSLTSFLFGLDGEPGGPEDHYQQDNGEEKDRSTFETFELPSNFIQHFIQHQRFSLWGLMPFGHRMPPLRL